MFQCPVDLINQISPEKFSNLLMEDFTITPGFLDSNHASSTNSFESYTSDTDYSKKSKKSTKKYDLVLHGDTASFKLVRNLGDNNSSISSQEWKNLSKREREPYQTHDFFDNALENDLIFNKNADFPSFDIDFLTDTIKFSDLAGSDDYALYLPQQQIHLEEFDLNFQNY
jgi:hypothetical protein